jgi:DNA-binding CsgD family transcriptional regulator
MWPVALMGAVSTKKRRRLHERLHHRAGRTFLSTSLANSLSRDIIAIYRGHQGASADPLSDRERQVLKLIAEGYTDRQIGELLFISLRTAQRHRYNIRTKLNLKRTADLVKYAISVRDDGQGFDACRHRTGEPAVERGMGLSALELRSRMIGADLKISSQPGQGTEINLLVPIKGNTVS